MDIEKIITDIIINIINAFLVPIVIPIFTVILKKEAAFETRTDTISVSLEKINSKKPKLISDVDEKIKLRNELPSAYFANLVCGVVYMYSNNFRTPFIIIYYTLIVISLILIVFVTRNYSETTKKRIINVTGIILIIFSLIIIFCPLKFKNFFLKNNVAYSQSLTELSVSGN